MEPELSDNRKLVLTCLGIAAVTALLTVSFAGQNEAVQTGRPSVYRIDTASAEPFAFLEEVLAGQRVVLLGESSHGVADFYERKADLARYLHEELGYGVLVFESGLADVATAYANAEDMPTQKLVGSSLLYDTEKLAPLFGYVKQAKGTGDPLRLAGTDLQSRRFADDVQALVGDSVDTAFLSGLRGQLYQKMAQGDVEGYNRLSRRFTKEADTLLRVLGGASPRGSRSYEEQALVRNVENFRDFFSFKYEKSIDAGFSQMQALRDRIMAENLRWLTETAFPEEKVIVWAHNGHVMKDDFEAKQGLGEYVHERMPKQSYAMGFVAYQGAAFEEHQGNDTLRFRYSGSRMMERRLAGMGTPELFVDFADGAAGRPAWASDSLQVGHNTTSRKTVVPNEAFDGVYFVETVSPENYLGGQ